MSASDYAKLFIDPEWRDIFGKPLRLSAGDAEIMKTVVELLESW